MKSISKTTEPASLAEHRSNRTENYIPTYGNLSTQALADLRNNLVAEQGAICCYCMSRIKADSTKMKIEHWESQEKHPDRQLDYSNLLGACLGGEKHGEKTLRNTHHCDTRKRNDALSLNPAAPNSNMESRLKYLRDGTIESDDAKLSNDINNVLNLNYSLLRSNRASVLTGLQRALSKRSLSRSDLQKLLKIWESPPFEPYCQIAINYLRKKLHVSRTR